MADDQQDRLTLERQRRKFYIVAFVLAFAIDLAMATFRQSDYRPTLIGLAVMIAAVLFFAYSWFRYR
jgi:hypothetical protein